MSTISIAVDTVTADRGSRVQIGNNIYGIEDRCLADLRSTDPRNDKTRIEQTKGGLLEDSYCWILNNADFQQWRDEQSRLLWIKGDPGKSKTMLLCGIINELKKETVNLVSYFFCQGIDSRINNATAVLRGLIYLLVEQQPWLISHVRAKYDQAGKDLFEGVNAWWALSDIFANILQDSNLKSTFRFSSRKGSGPDTEPSRVIQMRAYHANKRQNYSLPRTQEICSISVSHDSLTIII